MKNLIVKLVMLFLIIPFLVSGQTSTSNDVDLVSTYVDSEVAKVKYKTMEVDGINIAYREAGDINNPAIVLLHGFPSSSHQYRQVLEELSNDYYLVAPDYPGFGDSDFPSEDDYEYTFDNIANTIEQLISKKNLTSFALMIQDYGAPIGFRIATANPARVTGIINQNGNAYEEGLGDAWAGVRALWADRNEETEKPLHGVFTLEGLKWQYTHGTRNPELINPDNWNLDYLRMSRPNARKINLDLFYDYQNNIKLYPQWQKYLRDNQPPLLIVWGKNDAFFPESGAKAFMKDVKNIDYNIYNTGHFALEEDGDIIIGKIRSFMQSLNK